MRFPFWAGLLATGIVGGTVVADTSGTGYVTPTEMTMTFTSLGLFTASNTQITLLAGNYSHTFKRSDNDFAQASLSAINVPQGRYIGVQICYHTSRTVKLDGVKYQGQTIGGYTDGSLVWSRGTDAATTASIATSAPAGGATTLGNYVIGSGTSNCSASWFSNTVCVGSAAKCDPADTVVDPASTPPDLNLLLDMYHSVAIDANNQSLDNHVPIYPYPTIGSPGAAVHLTSGGAGSHADISLIFDGSKKMIYAAAYGTPVGSFCGGNGFVTVDPGGATPAGGRRNAYGPTAVMQTDLTGTGITGGRVQFAAGNCGTGGTDCPSAGMMTVNNFIQDQSQSASVQCVRDDAASPPFLGWSYPSGAGVSGGATGFTIQRVIDPHHIFGHCTTGSPGFIAGSVGSCGDYF